MVGANSLHFQSVRQVAELTRPFAEPPFRISLYRSEQEKSAHFFPNQAISPSYSQPQQKSWYWSELPDYIPLCAHCE
jgi:hypothetical protein